MSATTQSAWVAFGPSAPAAQPAHHAAAPAHPHPDAAYAAAQHAAWYQQQQAAYYHHQQAAYYQHQQQQQQAWAAYAQQHQAAAPPATGALVLYNPSGMLQSFQQQPTSSKPKANINPYTPGLEPLPVVPAPKTFVAEDAVVAKFPNSSKNARDSLNWITHEIFGEVKVSASSESQAKRTPLKELRQVSA